MNIKKILIGATAGALILSSIAISAFAAPVSTAPGQNKIQCFDGASDPDIYGGTCSLNSKGAKGWATLDNTDGNTNGDYSGVYILDASNMSGKPVGDITQLSFNYTGTPTNGSPRLTLPIDMNNDGATDDYLSISAYWCNNGAGLVDAINDSTCTIYLNSNGTTPVASNWANLVASHPDWKVTSAYPFLIADDAGYWTVGNVKLGKGGK